MIEGWNANSTEDGDGNKVKVDGQLMLCICI